MYRHKNECIPNITCMDFLSLARPCLKDVCSPFFHQTSSSLKIVNAIRDSPYDVIIHFKSTFSDHLTCCRPYMSISRYYVLHCFIAFREAVFSPFLQKTVYTGFVFINLRPYHWLNDTIFHMTSLADPLKYNLSEASD